METLTEIDKIVSWWLNLQKGYNDINNLDEVQRKLSGHYYYLCELMSEAYKVYLFSFIDKKIGLAKREQSLHDKGVSVTLAKSTASAYELDILNKEAESESMYMSLKFKVNATAKILESIRQRISNLKIELQDSKKHN